MIFKIDEEYIISIQFLKMRGICSYLEKYGICIVPAEHLGDSIRCFGTDGKFIADA